ncbi:hypothetical protein DIPPA_30787 [Diplonema papillatum]|nr:hypothetical protein DIPPA_30787 [Diplonema papillatum]
MVGAQSRVSGLTAEVRELTDVVSRRAQVNKSHSKTPADQTEGRLHVSCVLEWAEVLPVLRARQQDRQWHKALTNDEVLHILLTVRQSGSVSLAEFISLERRELVRIAQYLAGIAPVVLVLRRGAWGVCLVDMTQVEPVTLDEAKEDRGDDSSDEEAEELTEAEVEAIVDKSLPVGRKLRGQNLKDSKIAQNLSSAFC